MANGIGIFPGWMIDALIGVVGTLLVVGGVVWVWRLRQDLQGVEEVSDGEELAEVFDEALFDGQISRTEHERILASLAKHSGEPQGDLPRASIAVKPAETGDEPPPAVGPDEGFPEKG